MLLPEICFSFWQALDEVAALEAQKIQELSCVSSDVASGDVAVGQIRFGIPFWLVGEFTTLFPTDFSGDWDWPSLTADVKKNA